MSVLGVARARTWLPGGARRVRMKTKVNLDDTFCDGHHRLGCGSALAQVGGMGQSNFELGNLLGEHSRGYAKQYLPVFKDPQASPSSRTMRAAGKARPITCPT